MRVTVLRYIIVHLFMNSCSLVMGNQAAQSEYHHQKQYQQQQQQHHQNLLQPPSSHGNPRLADATVTDAAVPAARAAGAAAATASLRQNGAGARTSAATNSLGLDNNDNGDSVTMNQRHFVSDHGDEFASWDTIGELIVGAFSSSSTVFGLYLGI